jgi:hypothetical protein
MTAIEEYYKLKAEGKDIPTELWIRFTKERAELEASITRANSDNEKSKANEEIAKMNETLATLSQEEKVKLLEATKKQLKNKSVADGLSIIADTIDIGLSSAQIRESNRALSQIKPAKGISKLKVSEGLNNLIRNAQQQMTPGFIDSQVAPFTNQVNESFANDVNQARVASGGQAGAFGSYGQAAVNRRNQAMQGVVPMRASLLKDANANMAATTALEMQQNNAIAENDARRAALDYTRFKDEASAAGALGATGRLNMRNSLRSLLGNTSNSYDNFSGIRDVNKDIEKFKVDVNDNNSLANVQDLIKRNFNIGMGVGAVDKTVRDQLFMKDGNMASPNIGLDGFKRSMTGATNAELMRRGNTYENRFKNFKL